MEFNHGDHIRYLTAKVVEVKTEINRITNDEIIEYSCKKGNDEFKVRSMELWTEKAKEGDQILFSGRYWEERIWALDLKVLN